MRTRLAMLALYAGVAVSFIPPAPAQTEMRLWPDGAPGSEGWSLVESVRSSPSGDRVIANISDPSLTVFLPDPAVATGTAVVIAPGGVNGGFGRGKRGLPVDHWTDRFYEWLVARKLTRG